MGTALGTVIDIGPEADRVIERLRHLAPARPLDRARAESALAEYLRALGLEPRPVRWIEAEGDYLASARAGFAAAWETMCSKGRPEGPGFWTTATFDVLYGAGLRASGLIGAAEKQEKAAGHAVKRQTHKAVKAIHQRLDGALDLASRRDDLRRAVEEVLAAKGMRRTMSLAQVLGSTPDVREAQYKAELDREIAVGDATAQAAGAAYWLADAFVVRGAAKPADALEYLAHALLPLVSAVEAGLWLFWVANDVVIAVACPAA